MDSPMQRGGAIGLRRIHIRLVADERLDGLFVLLLGGIGLLVSIIGHGRLIGFFGAGLWLWLAAMLLVLIGMTWGAYRRLGRGGVARYLVTAASVPALIVYLAVANAVAIVGAGLGRKTEFNRTPKTGS